MLTRKLSTRVGDKLRSWKAHFSDDGVERDLHGLRALVERIDRVGSGLRELSDDELRDAAARLRSDPPGEESGDQVRVATFGLVMTILGCIKARPDAVAYAVGLYITAAYWFTASTSFANPAVTIARAFTDTFSGIAPLHAPAFIAAQVIGAVAATLVMGFIAEEAQETS